KPQSLLAAAEEERKQVSSKSKYKVRSLLPSLSVTPPPGSPTTSRKSGVMPTTAFDATSGISTPINSDTEADALDFRKAQKMEMTISEIISTPETHRAIRTITRGDFDQIQ